MYEELNNSFIEKVLIGTPCYNEVKNEYTSGIFTTAKRFPDKVAHCFEIGNPYVDDARNSIVDAFLQLDECSHLLFIDSDISFKSNDVFELMKHSTEEHKIVAGLYPRQKIDTEYVIEVVKQGCPPDQLNEFSGYVDQFGFAPIHNNSDLTEPIEVYHCLTGFMMIHKSVFTELKEKVDLLEYPNRDGYISTQFFKTSLHQEQGYLGEDINFCHMYRSIGGSIWLLPWVSVGHSGSFEYKRKVV